nr:myopalladin-like [Anser cygnoides]
MFVSSGSQGKSEGSASLQDAASWQGQGNVTMQSPSASLIGSSYGSTPVFTKGLQNIRATKGQLVVFECRIRATPTLHVHWYREYDQITDSADFRILRKKACSSSVPEEVCTLVITEAFPEDSGIFKCVAENEFGSVASSARLSVSAGEHICISELSN